MEEDQCEGFKSQSRVSPGYSCEKVSCFMMWGIYKFGVNSQPRAIRLSQFRIPLYMEPEPPSPGLS